MAGLVFPEHCLCNAVVFLQSPDSISSAELMYGLDLLVWSPALAVLGVLAEFCAWEAREALI